MPRERSAARQSERPLGRSAAFRDSDLRRAGVLLIALKLLLVPVAFDPRAYTAFPVPKAVLSHALSLPLLVVLALLLWQFRGVAWRPSPLHLPVALLVCAYAVSTALALDPLVALIGAPDRALGLLSLLDNALLYASLVALVRSRSDAFAIGAAAVLPIVPVVGYALAQWAGLDPLPWASGLSRTRPFSTFGNAGALAQYLGTLAAGALVLAHVELHDRPRWRAALAGLGIAALVGLTVSGARAAVAGVAVAALLYAGLAAIRATSGRSRALLAPAYAGTLLLAVAVVSLTPAGQRLQGLVTSAQEVATTEQARDGSVSGRVTLYEIALREVRARPVLGVGPDNYSVAFGRFRPAGAAAVLGSEAVESSPHSWLFKVGTDAGVVGLAAFAAVALTALALAVRSMRPLPLAAASAMISFLATGLFSINDIGTDWLLWAAAAAVAGGAAGDPATTPEAGVRQPRRAARPRSGLDARANYRLAAVGLTVVIALALGLRSIQAGEAAGRAASIRAAGHPADAASQARVAAALEPWRAEYWHELGLAQARSGQFVQSLDAFARAADLAPYHVTYLTNLARAEVAVALGGSRDALKRASETLRRAESIDPNASVVHYTRAIALLADGRAPEAAAAIERGALLAASNDAFVYEVAARAYLEAGRPDDAIRWSRQGLALTLTSEQAIALRLLLARALIALGRDAEARSELTVILTARPDEPAAKALLAAIDARAPR